MLDRINKISSGFAGFYLVDPENILYIVSKVFI